MLLLLFVSVHLRVLGSDKNRYKDKLEPGAKLMRSGANYTLERTVSGVFIYKEYFYETRQITHYATYLDKKYKTREGISREWFDDGSLWAEDTYKANLKNGPSIKYSVYRGSEAGNYTNGKKDGEWISRDSINRITAKCNYMNGKLDGLYEIYDKNGELLSKYMYKEGKILEAILRDSTYSKSDTIIEKMPAFPGCEDKIADNIIFQKCSEEKLLSYISTHIHYPEFARYKDITGTCYVSFCISKEGKVTDVKVLRGLCNDIMRHCYEVVSKMPDWHPGMQNNKTVRVLYNLPIRFSLK